MEHYVVKLALFHLKYNLTYSKINIRILLYKLYQYATRHLQTVVAACKHEQQELKLNYSHSLTSPSGIYQT